MNLIVGIRVRTLFVCLHRNFNPSWRFQLSSCSAFRLIWIFHTEIMSRYLFISFTLFVLFTLFIQCRRCTPWCYKVSEECLSSVVCLCVGGTNRFESIHAVVRSFSLNFHILNNLLTVKFNCPFNARPIQLACCSFAVGGVTYAEWECLTIWHKLAWLYTNNVFSDSARIRIHMKRSCSKRFRRLSAACVQIYTLKCEVILQLREFG